MKDNMKHTNIIAIGGCLIGILLAQVTSNAAENPTAPATADTGNKEALMRRIDFGNAYITGQTIKSGAVYLLQRKKSEIRSMLEYRENYRKEILEEFHTTKENVQTESPVKK